MPTGIHNLLNEDRTTNIESPQGLSINDVSLRVAQKQMLCGLKGWIKTVYIPKNQSFTRIVYLHEYWCKEMFGVIAIFGVLWQVREQKAQP